MTTTFQVLGAYDPTNTLTLRNAFARDMSSRFMELIRVIKKSVNERDCFGLRNVPVNQMSPTGANQFAFSKSDVKLAQFLSWLEEQVEKGIITTVQMEQIGVAAESGWTNTYIADSYKRGVLRARSEMKKAGYNVPTVDESGGIEAILNAPYHIDRVGLLYSRVFSDLKGITSTMDMQISRILAQGLADGDGPALLARKLVATINGEGIGELGITDSLGRYIPAKVRADMLARTEIIRAHHQATIQEYMNWRVEKVNVMAEVVTAGDRRVCSKCTAVAKGGPYTLEQAMNMIPVHTRCRCCAIPYIKKS